jgi:hypothetical protein
MRHLDNERDESICEGLRDLEPHLVSIWKQTVLDKTLLDEGTSFHTITSTTTWLISRIATRFVARTPWVLEPNYSRLASNLLSLKFDSSQLISRRMSSLQSRDERWLVIWGVRRFSPPRRNNCAIDEGTISHVVLKTLSDSTSNRTHSGLNEKREKSPGLQERQTRFAGHWMSWIITITSRMNPDAACKTSYLYP